MDGVRRNMITKDLTEEGAVENICDEAKFLCVGYEVHCRYVLNKNNSYYYFRLKFSFY
jgi:hypothetical protein